MPKGVDQRATPALQDDDNRTITPFLVLNHILVLILGSHHAASLYKAGLTKLSIFWKSNILLENANSPNPYYMHKNIGLYLVLFVNLSDSSRYSEVGIHFYHLWKRQEQLLLLSSFSVWGAVLFQLPRFFALLNKNGFSVIWTNWYGKKKQLFLQIANPDFQAGLSSTSWSLHTTVTVTCSTCPRFTLPRYK